MFLEGIKRHKPIWKENLRAYWVSAPTGTLHVLLNVSWAD